MNLITYKFVIPKKISACLPTDRKLLVEAEARGFYNGDTPYNTLFSKLFFSGGELNFKSNIPPKFAEGAATYLKLFMGSFEPKHEEKEAICAMILSELVDLPTKD